MIVIAPELSGGPEPRDTPNEHAKMFTKYSVTRTHWNRWGDSRITWSIRCAGCGKHAQMSQATYESVADGLAAAAAQRLACIPVPSPHHPRLIEQRYVVPLGVLCSNVASSNG